MPNTVPASAEGLPNLNRRSALAKLGLGLAASASLAGTAVAAPTGAVSLELHRLIEAHKAAFAAYDAAVLVQKEASDRYGTLVDENGLTGKTDPLARSRDVELRVVSGMTAAECATDAAVAVMNEAVSAICAYRCRSLAEVRRWGALLAEVITDDGWINCPQVILDGADWANITAALSSAGVEA